MIAEADCTGVMRGQCGPECGCCIQGCTKSTSGDGECDMACNTPRFNFDGAALTLVDPRTLAPATLHWLVYPEGAATFEGKRRQT